MTIQPQSSKKYSRSWAENIVRTWEKLHPRGADFLKETCSITHWTLVRVLEDGRPEWPQLKAIADQLERWEDRQLLLGQKPLEDIGWDHFKDGIIQILHNKIEPGLYNYLTASKNGS